MKKTKFEPKIHEFRFAILFFKKTKEHKPKNKKSYKPKKPNIRTQENQTQKIINEYCTNKINLHIPTQTQFNHTNTKQN